MNKETRKKLELKLVLAAEEILSLENEKASAGIHKLLKRHSRQVAKKFAKSVKEVEKNDKKLKAPLKTKPAAAKKKTGVRKKK